MLISYFVTGSGNLHLSLSFLGDFMFQPSLETHTLTYSCGSPSVVPAPAAPKSATPRNLADAQRLRPLGRPTEAESLRVGPAGFN